MTGLRAKMLADLQLRGLSERTQGQYIATARLFAEFHGESPAKLGAEEVRAFLLNLHQNGRKPATLGVYRSALKFLFDVTLERPEVMAAVPRTRVPRWNPGPALTRDEVRALLDAAVLPFDRTLFALMYATGLRISEARALQVGDIDARAELLHVRHGKGDKARSVAAVSGGLVDASESLAARTTAQAVGLPRASAQRAPDPRLATALEQPPRRAMHHERPVRTSAQASGTASTSHAA